MKIILINPSCVYESGRDLYSAHLIGPLFTMQLMTRMTLGVPLALPTLAACTPREHEVKIIDEEIEEIDFDESVDLVGITAMTFKAKRAYEIARMFRARGVPVVMGGIHASMCPDEVAGHVDCVVIGEAENLWKQIIADAASGKLKSRYVAELLPDITATCIPRYELVKNRQYMYSYLQTTRGCPFDCNFCTVTKMSGRKLRKKSADQVIEELDALLKLNPRRQFNIFDRASRRKAKFVGMIAFIDDNFAIDRNHALAICRAIKSYQDRLGIIFTWYTQVNFEVGFDNELLAAMREAHCQHLFIGFESLDPATLKSMNKSINSPDKYSESIRNIHRHDIRVVYSTIIGDDNASQESAEFLASFIESNNLFHVLLNILTPYPGTELYKEMRDEGRLLDYESQQMNIRNVVYKPRNLSPSHLQDIYYWLCGKFFSFNNVFSRGKNLLRADHRLSLPAVERLVVWAGLSFTCMFLAIKGRIQLLRASQIILAAPFLVLFNGSLFALEVLVASADYDDFARSEALRKIRESGKDSGECRGMSED